MKKIETKWPHPAAGYAMWIETWTAWSTACLWWMPKPPLRPGRDEVRKRILEIVAKVPRGELGLRAANGEEPELYVNGSSGTVLPPDEAEILDAHDAGASTIASDGAGQTVNGDVKPSEGLAIEVEVIPASGLCHSSQDGADGSCSETGSAGHAPQNVAADSRDEPESGEPSPDRIREGRQTRRKASKRRRRVLASSDGLASAVVFGEVPFYADEASHSDAAAEADFESFAPALEGVLGGGPRAGDDGLLDSGDRSQTPGNLSTDAGAQGADYERAGEPESGAAASDIPDGRTRRLRF